MPADLTLWIDYVSPYAFVAKAGITDQGRCHLARFQCVGQVRELVNHNLRPDFGQQLLEVRSIININHDRFDAEFCQLADFALGARGTEDKPSVGNEQWSKAAADCTRRACQEDALSRVIVHCSFAFGLIGDTPYPCRSNSSTAILPHFVEFANAPSRRSLPSGERCHNSLGQNRHCGLVSAS